jgi:hypothetical protein
VEPQVQPSKGEFKMRTPSSLAAWCTILFFLVYGLAAFVAFPGANVILGLLALGAAIFTLIGR